MAGTAFASPPSAQLEHAYAACRGIARASAKNFYYSFLVLPRRKRNALCAVYAFMRLADDISDDALLTPQERYAKLETWSEQARRAFGGEPTDDAVLVALADAQRRFQIPPELFNKLAQGTAMDLQYPFQPGEESPFAPYETFEELYQYCYHVASVVGLVCIHIFGYRDPAAEPLAEKCGIAFQLTNILRDVKEDAAMGRIYFPRQDLQRFSISPATLTSAHLRNGFQPSSLRPLLEFEAERAREFYRAGAELLPLIDADSRPALWVLIEIYRRLLEKMAQRNYDVFSERISLSTAEKLGLLSRGLLRRLAR